MIAIVKTLRFGAVLLLCVGVAGLLGCKQEAGSAPARPLPEVGVMTVAAQTIPDDPEFIGQAEASRDRKSTRLNSSHSQISYAVFCLKKKKKTKNKKIHNKNHNI